MATNRQVRQLIRAHLDGDDDGFYSCLLRIAAHEFRRGNVLDAREFEKLAERQQETLRGEHPRDVSPVEKLFEVSRPRTWLVDLSCLCRV